MRVVDELCKKAQSKDHYMDEQYWEQLVQEMEQFLASNPPDEEKKLLCPLGSYEIANMILAGIRYKKTLHNNGK